MTPLSLAVFWIATPVLLWSIAMFVRIVFDMRAEAEADRYLIETAERHLDDELAHRRASRRDAGGAA
jgi:hypothetical protein